jgi:hypothetical protein
MAGLFFISSGRAFPAEEAAGPHRQGLPDERKKKTGEENTKKV